jgi:2-(1,2-epoxy-1,2-dihydrophenyl)acetyl-CoA isomerase
MEDAMEIAVRLAKGPKSVTLIRKAMWDSLNNSFEQQIHLERKYQKEAGRTKDHKEGVTAFLEKRNANFIGE